MSTYKTTFKSSALATVALSVARAACLQWKNFVVFAVFLLISATPSYGIEGLSISIQNGTNVVLGWPSATNATYLIQYCPSLDASNSWQDLTNYYPACPNTNWTTYVVTNAIACNVLGGGNGTGGGSGGPPSPDEAILGPSTITGDTAAPFEQLAAGDSIIPPSPWIPESMPHGAILKASGALVPLPPPPRTAELVAGQLASPDDSTNNGTSGSSDEGFYLVVQNGVLCVGLTNGMVVSGVLTIPLEIAVPDDDPIGGAVLQVDGNMAPGGAAQMGANGLWTFSWDTTLVTNGPHQISATVIFGEDAVDSEVTNSLSVTVSNIISYPYSYSQVFGQGIGMWIDVQSAIAPADYQIAVYGSQTNYLGYFGGYTSNGTISILWGLQTGQNSPPLTDPAFRLDYYLFDPNTGQPLTSPSPAASTWMIGEAAWNPSGMLVACAPVDGNINHTYDVQYMVIYGVIDPMYGVPGGLQPACCNIPDGSAWTWGWNGDKSTLMQYTPGCNFLYYFGHGTTYSFGVDSKHHITYSDLVTNLHNFPASRIPTNSHPYKLVFLDGCLTAGGPLPEAFGIPCGQYDTNYFLLSGVRTRAYIGYSKEVSFSPDAWSGRSSMLEGFWHDWLSVHSIHYCVTNAQNAAWPMDSSAVIYGATNMNIYTY